MPIFFKLFENRYNNKSKFSEYGTIYIYSFAYHGLNVYRYTTPFFQSYLTLLIKKYLFDIDKNILGILYNNIERHSLFCDIKD